MSEARFGRRLLEVTGNDELGAYRVLRALDPDLAGAPGSTPEPGQFAMIAAAEHWGGGEQQRPYLPRAFSIARVAGEECHFLLEDVGPGTRRLCELRAGDGLWVLGPLGRGFQLGERELDQRRALLVGGGVGIAPLAILQDSLAGFDRPTALDARARVGADSGAGEIDVTVLLGFRDAARA